MLRLSAQAKKPIHEAGHTHDRRPGVGWFQNHLEVLDINLLRFQLLGIFEEEIPFPTTVWMYKIPCKSWDLLHYQLVNAGFLLLTADWWMITPQNAWMFTPLLRGKFVAKKIKKRSWILAIHLAPSKEAQQKALFRRVVLPLG